MAADLVYPRRCRFLGWHVTIFSLPGSPSTTPTNVLETVHFLVRMTRKCWPCAWQLYPMICNDTATPCATHLVASPGRGCGLSIVTGYFTMMMHETGKGPAFLYFHGGFLGLMYL